MAVERLNFHPSVPQDARQKIQQEYAFKAKPVTKFVIMGAAGVGLLCLGMITLQAGSPPAESTAGNVEAALVIGGAVLAVAGWFMASTVKDENTIHWNVLVRQVNPPESNPLLGVVATVASKAFGRFEDRDNRNSEVEDLEHKLKVAELNRKIKEQQPPTSTSPPRQASRDEQRAQIYARLQEIDHNEQEALKYAKNELDRQRIKNAANDARQQEHDKLSKVL